MRFSVDGHAIGQHLTGNEVYIRNLLRGFAQLDDAARFIAYLSVDPTPEWLPEGFLIRRVSRNPFVRLGWQIPAALRRDQPDLVHVQYTAPLACAAPIVVSVHDVSFLEHPEYFSRARALQLRITVERTVRKAARVLTPSEFSRRSIIQHYGVNESAISVIPNGVSSLFHPMPRVHAAQRVAERFGIRGPFLLNVGDLQPRKNQIGLIQAFEQVMARRPTLAHSLVLVGKDTWYGPRVHEAAKRSPLAGRIHFTGYVSDDDLRLLYNACEVFVFPSFYEGFGIPILEAMACGCAVACSNTTAMPEVADAATLLFDPHSTAEIARAIEDLLLDAELRARVRRLGLQRSTLFSWESAARRTLEVYYDVAGRPRAKVRSARVTQP